MKCLFDAAVGVHKEVLRREITDFVDRTIVDRVKLYHECGKHLKISPTQIFQEAISDIEESFFNAMTAQETAMDADGVA